MDEIYAPALDLPEASDVRWSSLTRLIRVPEECWPRDVLQKPIITGKIRNTPFALICDPDAARTVLTGGDRRFPKWLPIYRPSAGRGTGPNSIFVVSGEHWRFIRTQLAPLFAANKAEALVEQARNAAERMISSIGASVDTAVEFDAGAVFTEAALDVIWRTLTGDTAQGGTDESLRRAARGIAASNAAGDVSAASPWIEELASVAPTRPAGPLAFPANPLLQLMAGGRAADGQLSRAEASDNLLALLYSGQETTALATSWALWLIGQSPRLQERLQAETDSECGEQPLDLKGLRRLTGLNAVMKETLRLFSPSVVTVRSAAAPVQLAGQSLPAGTVIAVSIYAIQRHRRWWRDADCFRADRFAPGSDEPRHPGAFIPFSAGGHTCLAAKNSWWEILAMTATVLRRMNFETVEPQKVGVRTALVLDPDRPLRLRARLRQCR